MSTVLNFKMAAIVLFYPNKMKFSITILFLNIFFGVFCSALCVTCFVWAFVLVFLGVCLRVRVRLGGAGHDNAGSSQP